jgi:hypothetical protein
MVGTALPMTMKMMKRNDCNDSEIGWRVAMPHPSEGLHQIPTNDEVEKLKRFGERVEKTTR